MFLMACPTNIDEFVEQVTKGNEITEDERIKLGKVYSRLKQLHTEEPALDVGDAAMKEYKGKEITEEVRDYFDGYHVNLDINGSGRTIEKQIRHVYDKGNTIVINFDDRTLTFNKGQDRSHDIENGSKIKYVILNGLSEAIQNFQLGNKRKAKKKIDFSNLKNVTDYVHGDIQSMTTLLERLHKMGGNKTSDEDLAYYKNLLKRMNKSFFNDVKVFIKETADESFGVVTGDSIKLGISKNPSLLAGNQQTEAEIYMHEVIHTMTKFARISKTPEVRRIDRELDNIMSEMQKRLSWKDFMPKDSVNVELEELNAKALYEYIFNDENAKDEFIAHTLTNPQVRKLFEKLHLKNRETKSVFEQVVDMFTTLVDVILGKFSFADKNKSVYDMIYSLAFELAEINNKNAIELQKQESLIEKTSEIVNDIDAKLAKKLNSLKEKFIVDDKTRVPDFPENGSKFAKVSWTMQLLKKAIVNENYGKTLGLLASSYGLSPNGIIRNILRDFSTPSEAEKTVEWLQLQADTIEGKRNSLVAATRKNITELFSRKLKKAESKVLTSVGLDLDLGSLLPMLGKDKQPHQYSMTEIRQLLEDDQYLQRELSKAHHRLKIAGGNEYYNWYSNQAAGLGYYMATGKACIAQNLNAVNIARGLGSAHYHSPIKGVIKEVDTIATLKAIQYTDRHQKLQFIELVKNEKKGVEAVLRMHKGYNIEAKKVLFDDNSTHMVKGYSKELFDDTLDMKIAPLADKEEMTLAGYELKKVIEGKYAEGKPVGLFITKTFGKTEWLRGATRLINATSKGTTLTETKYADHGEFAYERAMRDIAKLDVERLKMADQMIKGTYDPTQNDSMDLIPLLDGDGSVVDYRYVMGKNAKEELLKQDKDVVEVLARSYGAMLDKIESPKHNKIVLDNILKDMKENWEKGILGKDLVTEYTLINEESRDPYVQEIYRILPQSFKDAIKLRSDKTLAVPTHMLPIYFGYRHMSIANSKLLQKVLPKIGIEALRFVEGFWMEAIKIAKANILLKIPSVLYDNIISNIIQGIAGGIDPITIIKMYKESFRDVVAHIKAHREYMQLESKRISGKLSKKDIDKMNILDKQMKENPVHILFEMGMYQAFQEDVEGANTKSSNKIKQFIDEKTENIPEFVKGPLQWLYLSEDTKYYKVMQEVMQMSDLVARDVQFRYMQKQIIKQADGKKDMPETSKYKGTRTVLKGIERTTFIKEQEDLALYTILQQFINYNKPASRLENYFNRLGTIKFTTYVKRIQPVVANMTIEHPVHTALSIVTSNYLGNLSNIQDQSVIYKGMFAHGFDPFNIVRTYSVMDDLKRITEPGLVTLADGLGLIRSPLR